MAPRRWIHWFLATSLVIALPATSLGQSADAARKAQVLALSKKIDQLIDSKRQLSQDLLEGSTELQLTEMKDDELLKLVALDLHAASQE